MADTTINPDEIGKFHKMAEEWWDPSGKFRPLHKFNPVRLAYIREKAIAHFARDEKSLRPFEGLSILDIGCGGGLLCEPMARLGADVVGADAGEKNIAVAKIHAGQSGLEIDYRATTAEALAAAGEQFDIVLNMEVVEHVADVPLYLQSCAALVKPGGLMFLATINRTARAFALAIVGAEYVLGWLPKGTHQYEKFLTPDEIISITRRHGLEKIDETGVTFNPLKNEWGPSQDMAVNYMLLFAKAEATTV
ncbi:bifunctional 2-polyprenyl-6-hydroxyphenol methylase/3-demethylubiquinol 3-O-methyltransferase UbiG [Pelagibacterium sediminicola]|uniref:bifunctional 2-polyprenyl-6-hydroxyphenol methylase/3-demethylubiquinol 3-O-methyltransferase UbiG n=1 Tax=Pelagibacterium sediminicola TaxID=2248761 RepID=UPI000E30D238|nr:bifunctional 2-polyprenyl-6-hydroxyphenol methylase/3-demethylubiquinol 3-O-methyltransferase UbiG [Pelagibacterium sediminicola]